MNGIEKITQRLNAETQSSVDSILSEAKSKAAEVEARAKADAERISEELRVRGERDAVERKERLVSVAEMEARKVILAAKQEMMEEAFTKALADMCGAADEVYAKTCANLLAKAAPDGMGEVIFAEGARERIGAKAVSMANELLGSGKLVLSEKTRPIEGGFILVKGNVEINCSYETLVRLQRSEASGDVAELLFSEG